MDSDDALHRRHRKKVLGGTIAERLKNLLTEILAVEVMPDHTCTARKCRCVHLFVSAPPKGSPAEIVRYFKGITSRRLKQESAYLRRQYWGEHATLWAEGYYVGTAGHTCPGGQCQGVSAEVIKRYIQESQTT